MRQGKSWGLGVLLTRELCAACMLYGASGGTADVHPGEQISTSASFVLELDPSAVLRDGRWDTLQLRKPFSEDGRQVDLTPCKSNSLSQGMGDKST